VETEIDPGGGEVFSFFFFPFALSLSQACARSNRHDIAFLGLDHQKGRQ
jgi:hypothetical protein